MYMFVVAVHVVLSLLLIFIIILQPGKSGDVGAAFGGGGGSTMFGPRGPTSLLARGTTGVAVMFMVTSVVLALYSNKGMRAGGDIGGAMEEMRAEQGSSDDGETEGEPPPKEE